MSLVNNPGLVNNCVDQLFINRENRLSSRHFPRGFLLRRILPLMVKNEINS